MSEFPYQNQKCPYCGQPFAETDDIVVCPDCGTPHHRSCWQSHGVCARAAQHGQPMPEPTPDPQPAAAAPVKQCPRCGYRNPPDAAFCSGCGFSFGGAAPAQPTQRFDRTVFDPTLNFSGESDFEDIPAADVARLVGANTSYYMPVFARIRAHSGSRFHFCALLFGGAWMLFRKQYKTGAVVLALQLLLRVLQYWVMYALYVPLMQQVAAAAGVDLSTGSVTMEQFAVLSRQIQQLPRGQMLQLALPVLVGLAGLIFSIVIGCCANRWYYRHTLRTARRIRAEKAEACAESELLAGGVNRPLGMTMLLCALIWSLFSDRILAVIIQLFAK